MMHATSTFRHFTTKATGVGRSTAGSQSRDNGSRVAAIICAGLTFSASGAGVTYYLNLQNNFTTTTTPAFLAGGGAASKEEEQRRRHEAMRRRQQQGNGGSGSSGSGGGGGGGGGVGGVNKWLIVGGVAIVSLFSFALTRYKRCSPNEVLVVFGQTGAKGPAKIVHGGGTVVWPIIQDFRHLSLEPFAIEVPLHKALSKEKVRVSVPSVFTIAIGNDPEIMQKVSCVFQKCCLNYHEYIYNSSILHIFTVSWNTLFSTFFGKHIGSFTFIRYGARRY